MSISNKVTKYNTKDGLFDKPTIEVKSKKELLISRDIKEIGKDVYITLK